MHHKIIVTVGEADNKKKRGRGQR